MTAPLKYKGAILTSPSNPRAILAVVLFCMSRNEGMGTIYGPDASQGP